MSYHVSCVSYTSLFPPSVVFYSDSTPDVITDIWGRATRSERVPGAPPIGPPRDAGSQCHGEPGAEVPTSRGHL